MRAYPCDRIFVDKSDVREDVAYYKKIHGKRKLFHVEGIILPKKCPRGGWPVASKFSFEDGSTVLAKRTVPCPK